MPKVLKSIAANRGVEARYRKALEAMIKEMANSVEYWLTAAYRKTPPKMTAIVDRTFDSRAMYASVTGRVGDFAQDASPSQAIKKQLDALAQRWRDKFDEYAPKLAEAYVSHMFKTSDSAFRKALKDAGYSVKFKMTPAARDAFNATLTENVGLIKSIPEQYLTQVEGVVMRSYTIGRDLQAMVTDLKKLYPAASNRAELIARDQSNKANAVVNRTRQMELGITHARWMHSHAGKTPRLSHLEANGEEYEIAKGMFLDGEWLQPGEAINCRCTSRPILPF